jgi:hypothetical protein
VNTLYLNELIGDECCPFQKACNINDTLNPITLEKINYNHEIPEPTRTFYCDLLNNDPNELIKHIQTSCTVLPMLNSILECARRNQIINSKNQALKSDLIHLKRSQVIAKNPGGVILTHAIELARKSSRYLVNNKNGSEKPFKNKNNGLEPSAYGDSHLVITKRPNASKIIVCAGNQRSGSTWLYNIVRLAYISAGYKTYGAWIDEYIPTLEADIHIIKTHQFHEGLSNVADIVIVSTRDLRDCAASLVRKQWISHAPEEFKSLLRTEVTRSIVPWRKRADINVAYEDTFKDKIKQITKLISQLGLEKVDPEKLNELVDNLSLEIYHAVNPVTMLSPKHITDGTVHSFDKSLTEAQIAAVIQIAAEFNDIDLLCDHSEKNFNKENFRYARSNSDDFITPVPSAVISH